MDKIFAHIAIGLIWSFIIIHILEKKKNCAFRHPVLIMLLFVVCGAFLGTLILAIVYPIVNKHRKSDTLDEDEDVLGPLRKQTDAQTDAQTEETDD